mgnify:FL=1
MYNFYFSENFKNHRKKCEESLIMPKKTCISLFNGNEYTEMVEFGKPCVTGWAGDLVHLGSGFDSDITFKPI